MCVSHVGSFSFWMSGVLAPKKNRSFQVSQLKEILQKLKASCFDRLLMGSTTVDREMPIPEASSTVSRSTRSRELLELVGLSICPPKIYQIKGHVCPTMECLCVAQ